MDKFCQADLSDVEWTENCEKAKQMYKEGQPPSYSSGICESITAGYGRLDEYGYWEYPLMVDQKTQRIIICEV